MVADSLDVVIGVDTHRDAHALALVATASGALLLEAVVEASREGYGDALELARAHARGRRAWAIEGTGCYGAGLARFLLARGERVLEVDRPRRERRAQRGKSDALDALRAEPARFSVYRWVVRCCRGCGLRSGCVGLPSRLSSCNSFAMSSWRVGLRARSVGARRRRWGSGLVF